MSLDDESPTQYFGADAEVWESPDGRTLQISPSQTTNRAKLTEIGWTRSGQEPLVHGPELANPEVTEPLHHRVGCSHSRTGRCICAYLAQWDKHPEYTAPSFKLGELSLTAETMQVDRTTSDPHGEDDTPWDLDENEGDWDCEHTRLAGAGTLVIPDEMWADFDHSKPKVSGSPEFISASEYAARRQPAPFPMEEKDYYPVIDKPDLKALTVNGEIWEPRALRTNTEDSLAFWKGQAKSQRRWNLVLLMILAAEGVYITGRATGWF